MKPLLAAVVAYAVAVWFTNLSGLPTAVYMLAAVGTFVFTIVAAHVDRLQRRIAALEAKDEP